MLKYFLAIACPILLFAFTSRNSKSESFNINHSGIQLFDSNKSILSIDLNTTFQTIHSFGASDCWTAKFAGTWKNETKKNAIADLLFSTSNLPDGSPRGIGLSLWRFNIGAGSTEQGAASGIPDEYRREKCFLNANGKYDWGKQTGGQWFLTAAKKRGVKYLLAFTNSAPVQFTQNGLSYGLSSNNLSLKEDRYNEFASFLVEVCKHFKAAKLPFDFVSPVNEPQWKWGEHPSQEGSGSTNEETAKLVRILGPQLKAAGLTTTITASEAGQINFLYGSNEKHIGDQLNEFFNTASANYIGNVPNTEKVISYHSYFSTCPDSALLASRQQANEKRKSVDPAVQLWQSEFGVLGDICGNLNGGPRNTDINYGVYVAKVIHTDLAVASASSFQWWLAINPYDYSDGLVYINAPDGSINPDKSKEDGIVSSSKQLWCMGNFSRFIRPGMKRVAASFNGTKECFVSAYKNEITKQLVTVIVNSSTDEVGMHLQTSKPLTKKSIDSYTTSATQNMQWSNIKDGEIRMKPMSVTTLVTSYK